MTEAHAKYRTIFKHYMDAVLLVDPGSGLIKEANQAARRFLRHDKDDLVGQHLAVLFPREAGASPKDLVEELRIYGHIVEEHEMLLGTGEKVSCDVSAVMFDLDHEAVVMITLHDATQRKDAAKELRKIRALHGRLDKLSKAYDAINSPLQELLSLVEVQGKERLKRPLTRITAALRGIRTADEHCSAPPYLKNPGKTRSAKWEIPCTQNKILIVDDEIDARNLFHHIIRGGVPEAELDMAADGEDAVRAFQEGHHAVIVMDLDMPRMSGDQAFAKIEAFCRDRYWQMPTVILCTGHALQESLAPLADPEMPHSCLLKPVSSKELVQVVQQRLAYSAANAPEGGQTSKAATRPAGTARFHAKN